MNVLNMLINDPVVLYSFIGLAVLLGICGFYVYYFLKHISEDEK
ncbi:MULTISPECIES: DUF3149 domain-containing protein [unclassified Colwellia]|jgi:hypothetical protein|nr:MULTISPECIES: DUF3149 domain-containing protein [unclassified Colwellia]MBA6223469.1 DUF3149 domain-containing protein [Colwellia sp. MB3u-45]MBA6267994.1 DUF3149 domain-containing protein [Colwellia sp. MB3u-43]MBA6287797.1 DUF3149 domain-containing protein [Colwellia sp. MB3u-4]MBA6293030.1 DUF3149 domain-containing protein [Colwellia sp. MB3u-8]MBA6295291.1 DUF3149 domain-containing protein [Colwellia sp. MB02u-9]